VFFFQAEDGIRDDLVTGVQTCALPIYLRHASWSWRNAFQAEATQALVVACQFALALQHVNLHRRLVIFRRGECLTLARRDGRIRSEERRVGKECRCGWLVSHNKNSSR